MNRLSRLACFFLLPLALAACDSSAPGDDVSGVYVLNQGAFGNDASGGVTTYDPETGTAGALSAPGGLVQAGVVRDGRLYLLINFSDSFTTGRGRLDVIDVETGATLQQIDVGTPRGIAFVGQTAFVTDLYGAAVTPVDLASGTAGTPIPVGDNPEGIAFASGQLFVANSGFGFGTTVSVIDPGARTVTETIDLECESPNDVLTDERDNVWVMCNGRSDFSTGNVVAPGQILGLDADARTVVSRSVFGGQTLGGSALGQDLAYDADEDELYFIASPDEVLRFFPRDSSTPESILVAGGNAAGIGFADGQLYVARLDAANPFSDDGAVSVVSPDGTVTDGFDAGVVPAAFAFDLD
ncbi:MAG: hypothetical protein AAFQ43_02115 [Bacteroidota bacterium]